MPHRSGGPPPQNALGHLLDSAVPCVAVSFTDAESVDDIAVATQAGLDIAEIRIDRCASDDVWLISNVIRRFSDVPTIATIRSRDEGGDWDGTEDERLALFNAIIPNVDAIDIELGSGAINKAVIDEAHRAERCAIVSYHDFDSTPAFPKLVDVFTRARSIGADLVKIAAMVTSPDDLRALAAFTLAHHDKGVIVIGMGDLGTPTRVLFPFLGSKLTFAAGFRPSAPGQLGLPETVDALRLLSADYAARHPRPAPR